MINEEQHQNSNEVNMRQLDPVQDQMSKSPGYVSTEPHISSGILAQSQAHSASIFF